MLGKFWHKNDWWHIYLAQTCNAIADSRTFNQLLVGTNPTRYATLALRELLGQLRKRCFRTPAPIIRLGTHQSGACLHPSLLFIVLRQRQVPLVSHLDQLCARTFCIQILELVCKHININSWFSFKVEGQSKILSVLTSCATHTHLDSVDTLHRQQFAILP